MPSSQHLRASILLAALFGASLTLASCGTRPAPPLADPVKPVSCPADLKLPVDKEPAGRGSIIQPETAEERLVVDAHLTSDAEARDWGRKGWDRAAAAKGWCEKNGR